MAKRRSRGDSGLYWSASRQRWIAEVTIDYQPNGKRITRSASGKTKTAAKDKLKEMLRDLDDGLPVAPDNYYVRDAVQAWFDYGLNGRDQATIDNYKCLSDTHIIRTSERASSENCPPTTWTNGLRARRKRSAHDRCG